VPRKHRLSHILGRILMKISLFFSVFLLSHQPRITHLSQRFYRLFIFFSTRFFGSLGFFTLLTSIAISFTMLLLALFAYNFNL
jgi:hypothetical protein